MESPHRPIPVRSPLTPPPGVEVAAIEAWVRRRTKARIDLENYVIEGSREGRKDRERRLRYARALQRELLHFENWDGTPRI